MASDVSSGSDVTEGASASRRLRVLHLIIVLGETNGQYNERTFHSWTERDLAICTYFRPQLEGAGPDRGLRGDDTLRGFFRALGAALDGRVRRHPRARSAHGGSAAAGLALHPGRWRLFRKLVYTVQDSYYDYKPRKALMLPDRVLPSRRLVDTLPTTAIHGCGSDSSEARPRRAERGRPRAGRARGERCRSPERRDVRRRLRRTAREGEGSADGALGVSASG